MSFVFLIRDSVMLVEIWVKAHNSFITGLISPRNYDFRGKENKRNAECNHYFMFLEPPSNVVTAFRKYFCLM